MTKRKCATRRCTSQAVARGMCRRHYNAWWRTHRDETRRVRPVAERFWAKVDKNAPNGCWLWTAGCSPDGYGLFHFDERTGANAHRVAYQLLVGEIPAGFHLHHVCRTRRCVNPAHLEPIEAGEHTVTHAREITHCKRGHELCGDNVYLFRGVRFCRKCRRIRDEARRQRRCPRTRPSTETAAAHHRGATRPSSAPS